MAKTAPEPGDEFCGTTYAAKLLQLSVATVQGLVEAGQLEAWKTQGGHRRISMRSLADYMKSHGLERAAAVDVQSRLRVLIVDDDQAMRELYRARLQGTDLPIDFSVMSSALEALMDIGSVGPDVLIADLNMPGIDGFDMVRMLRAAPRHADMAIVVVTGLTPEDIERRGGLPEGVICRFKPLDTAWLEGFLHGVLYGRHRAPAAWVDSAPGALSAVAKP
jgi:excisionase family DNA binding protein